MYASERQAYREKNWNTYFGEYGNDPEKAEQALQAYFESTYFDQNVYKLIDK